MPRQEDYVELLSHFVNNVWEYTLDDPDWTSDTRLLRQRRQQMEIQAKQIIRTMSGKDPSPAELDRVFGYDKADDYRG